MVCHRPEGLEQLEAQTNFTKQELQVLYRGFKNVRCPVFLISSFSSLPHLRIYFTQMSFDTFWNLIRSLQCLCNISLCLNIFTYESLHLICIYCPRGSVCCVSSVLKTFIIPLCIIQHVTNHCVLASGNSQLVIFHNTSIHTLYQTHINSEAQQPTQHICWVKKALPKTLCSILWQCFSTFFVCALKPIIFFTILMKIT